MKFFNWLRVIVVWCLVLLFIVGMVSEINVGITLYSIEADKTLVIYQIAKMLIIYIIMAFISIKKYKYSPLIIVITFSYIWFSSIVFEQSSGLLNAIYSTFYLPPPRSDLSIIFVSIFLGVILLILDLVSKSNQNKQSV